MERVLASGTTEAKSARNLYCALHSERGTVLKGEQSAPAGRASRRLEGWIVQSTENRRGRYAAVKWRYARVGRLQTFVNEKD